MSSSLEPAEWRYSTISWSPISLRAHWMAPTPMHSSARPKVTPSAMFEAPNWPNVLGSSPTLKVKYEAMNRIMKTVESPNRLAT